ncbi:hypothetical protein G4B88_028259 [Cannabis sativa]|uniref:Cytochrome P450 n=1 Tax=Cannabis sativa TaxID=3483 RepID=A0A7J6GD68_CANSA|nr:hypothetical protein G4B88_028259 [Cannabis sativa]
MGRRGCVGEELGRPTWRLCFWEDYCKCPNTTSSRSFPLAINSWMHSGDVAKQIDIPILDPHSHERIGHCIRLGTSTHVISITSPEIAREFLKKHDMVFASRPLTGVTRLISHDYKAIIFAPWGEQ